MVISCGCRRDDRSWFGGLVHWFKQCCFQGNGSHGHRTDRRNTITLSLPLIEGDFLRPTNSVRTSKYTWYDFIPRATALQFRRFTNTFYLLIAILGTVGWFVPNAFLVSFTPWGTLMILAFVIGVTLIFEGWDDLDRHRADSRTNGLPVERAVQASEDQSVRFDVAADSTHDTSTHDTSTHDTSTHDTPTHDTPTHDSSTHDPVMSPSSTYTSATWGSLRPGNVICIRDGELVPADVLLLRTSHNETQQCYIETSGIDGETNLKLKAVGQELSKLVARFPCCADVTGRLIYEAPNALLSFSGRLEYTAQHEPSVSESPVVVGNQSYLLGADAVPLDYSQVLLRGSRLRNTAFVEALVLYAGPETKLVLSSRRTPSKFSILDSFVNRMMGATMVIYLMIVVLVTLLLLLTVPSTEFLWYFAHTSSTTIYALPAWLAFFFTFCGMFALIIPIDTYVCLEIASFVQAWLINHDAQMYDPVSDCRATIKTGNLVAEVGQVTHVFSDKTGTLTKNEMRLVGMTIVDRVYGFLPVMDSGSQTVSSIDVPNVSGREMFPHLVDILERRPADLELEHQRIVDMLTVLSVCHTVIVDRHPDGTVRYNAEGPDEGALVDGAASVGCRLQDTGKMVTTVRLGDETIRFRVLAVNPFSSDRKRMSVLAEEQLPVEGDGSHTDGDGRPTNEDGRPTDEDGLPTDGQNRPADGHNHPTDGQPPPVQTRPGRRFLFVKGADNVMFARLRSGHDTTRNFVSSQIDQYSVCGLRTLVVARREVSVAESDAWLATHKAASGKTGLDRVEGLSRAAEAIEKDLELVGATAIEDALQEGVPDTIRLLREAGIHVWVLTGDKVQTATNIAFSAKLLDRTMQQIKFTQSDVETYVQEIDVILDILANKRATSPRDLDGLPPSSGATAGLYDGKDTKPESLTRDQAETLLPKQGDGEWSDDEPQDLQDPSRNKARLLASQDWTAKKLALVVTGESLEMFLASQRGTQETEEKLLALASKCAVVLACRVSPKQKALLVQLVSESRASEGAREPVTLAIGDGANDVPMIQHARVGVGISGHEGLQAANSADFAIAQFRFLQRLLFVHGRWNYIRNARLVKFVSYSWQVLAYQVFFYLFLSMISGQSVFYNAYYLTLFAWVANSVIVAVAWFDRDVKDEVALHNPKCYAIGRENRLLDVRSTLKMSLRALLHAVVIMLGAFMYFPEAVALPEVGSSVYTMSILVMNARQMEICQTYTWFVIAAFVAAFALFLGMVTVIDLLTENVVYMFSYGSAYAWLPGLWVVGTVVVMDILVFEVAELWWPSPYTVLRELDRGYYDGQSVSGQGNGSLLVNLGLVSPPEELPHSSTTEEERKLNKLLRRASEYLPSMEPLEDFRSYDYSYLESAAKR